MAKPISKKLLEYLIETQKGSIPLIRQELDRLEPLLNKDGSPTLDDDGKQKKRSYQSIWNLIKRKELQAAHYTAKESFNKETIDVAKIKLMEKVNKGHWGAIKSVLEAEGTLSPQIDPTANKLEITINRGVVKQSAANRKFDDSREL